VADCFLLNLKDRVASVWRIDDLRIGPIRSGLLAIVGVALLSGAPSIAGAFTEKDALNGDPGAMIWMGDACADPHGNVADLLKQEDWYCRAADTGNTYGLMRLAGLYGRREMAPAGAAWSADVFDRLAHRWAFDQIPAKERAVVSDGFLGLARCYADGSGRPQDLHTAVELYRQALSLGNRSAAEQLRLIGTIDGPATAPQFIPFSAYRWSEIDGVGYDGKPCTEKVLQYSPERSVVVLGDPDSEYARHPQAILLFGKDGPAWKLLSREDIDTEMNVSNETVVLLAGVPYLFFNWASCSDCGGTEVRYLGNDKIEALEWDKTLWLHRFAEIEPEGYLKATGDGFYAQSDFEWNTVELAFRLEGRHAYFDRERTKAFFTGFFEAHEVSTFSLRDVEASPGGDDGLTEQQRMMCLRMLLEIEGRAIAPEILRYLDRIGIDDNGEVRIDAKMLLGLK
jgi:hypothetical protein